jgi:hypothetical protein
MDVHFPTLEEWIRLVTDPDNRQGREGEVLVGTIADVLQVAERCKKGRAGMEVREFHSGWETLRRGRLIASGTLHVLGLDQEGLLDALFDTDRSKGEAGVSLWTAVVGTETRPWRTVRRLILRPLDSRWWGDGPYEQMEAYFGEEPGRNE